MAPRCCFCLVSMQCLLNRELMVYAASQKLMSLSSVTRCKFQIHPIQKFPHRNQKLRMSVVIFARISRWKTVAGDYERA